MVDLEGKKFPDRVKRVFATLNTGQRLCKSMRHKETGETKLTFTFEPSGRKAGPKSAQAAIDSGLLTPLGDGLFGAETSQTWIAA